MPEYIVGLDLGGTKIQAGLITPTGQIAGSSIKQPTQADKPREVICDNIFEAIKRVIESHGCSRDDVVGIGIGSPGPLDLEQGLILDPPNLPSLHQVPLKNMVEKEFQLPVYLNNDANVFVLGECYFGAGKSARIVYGVTLGTGIGSGFVVERKLYTGATGTAAEIWCFPHENGIIEDYVSGRGLTCMFKEKGGGEAEPAEIAELARRGHVVAKETWQEFGRHLGLGLSYVVNVVDPELILVGGSLSKAFELFAPDMESSLKAHINTLPRERIRILPAELGDDAGWIGAACLVMEGWGDSTTTRLL